MRRVLATLVLGAAPAYAAPATTTVTAEGGGEEDTNVTRIDNRAGEDRIQSAVARAGAKLDTRGKLLGGAYLVQVATLARLVANPDAQSESVAFGLVDLRWLHPLGERPVLVGLGVTAADASPINGTVEPDSRTFRTLGADAILVLKGGEDHTLSLAVGARSFEYKPNHEFDWTGPSASLRLDLTLWQQSGGTRSVELAAFAGAESRAYDSVALANICAPDAMPDDPRTCSAATSLPRRDRYERAGVELTYTGPIVATAGYQAAITDSNSFGQSFVRHRITLLGTTDLPWSLLATVLVTLQFDQYLDGLIVEGDLLNQSFTTIGDENRSSIQVRLARQLTDDWALESRLAVWRDLEGDNNTTFRRSLFYLGAVFSR